MKSVISIIILVFDHCLNIDTNFESNPVHVVNPSDNGQYNLYPSLPSNDRIISPRNLQASPALGIAGRGQYPQDNSIPISYNTSPYQRLNRPNPLSADSTGRPPISYSPLTLTNPNLMYPYDPGNVDPPNNDSSFFNNFNENYSPHVPGSNLTSPANPNIIYYPSPRSRMTPATPGRTSPVNTPGNRSVTSLDSAIHNGMNQLNFRSGLSSPAISSPGLSSGMLSPTMSIPSPSNSSARFAMNHYAKVCIHMYSLLSKST